MPKKSRSIDMDVFTQREILETFRIIIDNREHNTPRAAERYAAFGKYEKATLSYGDYCGNVQLPSGAVYNTSETVLPRCVIERKMSLDELAGCFTRGRDRFRREFERARNAQAKVYLLVEGGSWEAIMNHRYRSRFRPEAFKASLTAWMVRYDASVVFCKTETAGPLIREILYRDMKERLEKGEYG